MVFINNQLSIAIERKNIHLLEENIIACIYFHAGQERTCTYFTQVKE